MGRPETGMQSEDSVKLLKQILAQRDNPLVRWKRHILIMYAIRWLSWNRQGIRPHPTPYRMEEH